MMFASPTPPIASVTVPIKARRTFSAIDIPSTMLANLLNSRMNTAFSSAGKSGGYRPESHESV